MLWIEAGDVVVETVQQGSLISVRVGTVAMRIRADEHGNEASAQFAAILTNYYELLERAYPEFARLRELARVIVVYRRIWDLLLQLRLARVEATGPKPEEVASALRRARNDLPAYPCYKEEDVSYEYQAALERQGIDPERVRYPEQVRAQIRTQMKERDAHIFQAVLEQLATQHHVEQRTIRGYIDGYLRGDERDTGRLSSVLAEGLERELRQRWDSTLAEFERRFSAPVSWCDLGYGDELDLVPGGYTGRGDRRVFGAVVLNPTIRSAGLGAGRVGGISLDNLPRVASAPLRCAERWKERQKPRIGAHVAEVDGIPTPRSDARLRTLGRCIYSAGGVEARRIIPLAFISDVLTRMWADQARRLSVCAREELYRGLNSEANFRVGPVGSLGGRAVERAADREIIQAMLGDKRLSGARAVAKARWIWRVVGEIQGVPAGLRDEIRRRIKELRTAAGFEIF